jgi:putative DNA primase/helicase
LVGRKNFSNVSWQDLSGRFSTSCLYGKILNTFSDLPSRAIEDNGMFKSLIGPDMIQVERKNRDPFSFLSKCKLLFSANEMPHNSGDKSEGFFSKLIIIRFLKSVQIDRIDPDLLTKFIEEIDGIFNWAMQGLDTLIANKFAFSKSVIVNEEVYKYKRNSNNVLSYVDELCEFDPSYFILSQELFNHYKNVCNTNGFKSLSISNFNLEMVSNYGSKITQALELKTRRSIWRGIRFFDNPNVSEEELMQIMQALNTTKEEKEGTAKSMRRPYKD